MTYKEILKTLENKKYAPIYLLHGDESFFVDKISNYIEKNVLSEAEKAFNQVVLYGKEIEFKQVVDEARQFPMMANYRVVIVKEAQEMRTIDKLEHYLENPSPQSIVVISFKHKKLDKRKKFYKKVAKTGIVFESKKLYDNQLPAWISDYLKTEGYKIDFNASQMVADYLGNDLSKIANELNKLTLNIAKGSVIKSIDIQEQIGISKDYNVFELQKAIGAKDTEKVFRIIQYFSENEKAHPLPLVIGNLFSFFSKLYITAYNLKTPDNQLQRLLGLPSPYFVKDYKSAATNLGFGKIKATFHALKKADLASKGYGSRNQTSKGTLQDLAIDILY
jgi:DNA polymerase-3 subunit delta